MDCVVGPGKVEARGALLPEIRVRCRVEAETVGVADRVTGQVRQGSAG